MATCYYEVSAQTRTQGEMKEHVGYSSMVHPVRITAGAEKLEALEARGFATAASLTARATLPTVAAAPTCEPHLMARESSAAARGLGHLYSGIAAMVGSALLIW